MLRVAPILMLALGLLFAPLVAEGLEGLLPKDKIEELKRYDGGAHRFITARVDDPGLVAELETANG